MDSWELKMCDIQGRLFENAAKEGYDCEKFVDFFMKSPVAKGLDSKYNHYQWAGEEYLLDEIIDLSEEKIKKVESNTSSECMYWIGYIYRYWHYYKNETSKNIYRQAKFKTMMKNYFMFHTMDPELAIEDLIEINKQGKVAEDSINYKSY